MRGYGCLIGPDLSSRVAKQPRAWPSRELDESRALIPHTWSAEREPPLEYFWIGVRHAKHRRGPAAGSYYRPPAFASCRYALEPHTDSPAPETSSPGNASPRAETLHRKPTQVVEETTRRLPGRRLEGQINHGSRVFPHLGAHVRQERDADPYGRTRWSRSVWKSTSVSGARGTGIAPSSRRRVDGVEDDAMIQHERAVKF